MSEQLLDVAAALARRGVDCIMCVGVDVGPTTTTRPLQTAGPCKPHMGVTVQTPPKEFASTPKESDVVGAAPPKEPCLATVKDIVAFMTEHDIATTEPNGSVTGVGQWRLGMNESTPAWLLPISEENLTHRAMLYTKRKGLAPFTNVLTVSLDSKTASLRLAT
jgi:hypothetical protein